jgi:hypothetical protein
MRNKNKQSYRFFWLAIVLSLFALRASAQSGGKVSPPPPKPPNTVSADKSLPSDDDNAPPLTTYEEEMKAKRLIKIAEKEHQENINRAREISQLGKELEESFKKNNTLDRDDTKRLERIEKLTKKVRGEAGGGDSETQVKDRPSDIPSTMTRIAAVTDSLLKNVQNTPRQVVSASVIDDANVLLELIRIMKGFAPVR